MHDGPGSGLTLDQAYQAAYLWMFHVGEAPTQIAERGTHAVELRSDRLVAFVRVPDRPLNQRTVLAVLTSEPDDRRRIIFSTTGFTLAAISIAEAQDVALFGLGDDGAAHPRNDPASALATTDDPPTPFAVEDQDEGTTLSAANWGPSEFAANEWVDCAKCGTNQHHSLTECRICGEALGGAVSLGSPPDGLNYRCRECGSHDVEIVAASDPARRS